MMAEVSCCVRTRANKLNAFKTLWTHYQCHYYYHGRTHKCDVSAAVCLSSESAGLLINDRPRAAIRINQQTPVRSHCTLTQTRAFSWRRHDPPLYTNRTAYYDVLRVSPNAAQAQIKSAYYKQSFIYHPDRNAGSEEASRRFALIAEAYSVLGSVALRRRYDRGELTHSDVQNSGRPSSSSSSSSSHASNLHHHHHHQRTRRVSDASGKSMFDFDAFYQAHYGEQLQREKQMRHKQDQVQQQQREHFRNWKRGKMTEMTVGFLLVFGGVILMSLRS
ncbi:dnaJ (Hsp40) homolog, subfamily C, member 30b [Xyrauchen texanus]|uniref:dnaJ (Hsp40) homolog, subfamily C, member 30b n=1 Tax=Xyrauchen texanus TaxID=154827 RepID=UPI002242A4D8|nr:dnaJ (Hsp40) homolog, subfamily C, member 30b [Xyrauchen texanus]